MKELSYLFFCIFCIPSVVFGIDNDFKSGAILINSTGCSQEYTTVGGTPDGSGSSCNHVPYANRWFKFQASSQIINVELIRGTILSPKMTLWTFDGQEIACEASASNVSNLSVGSISLTPGEIYYISVDNGSNATWKGSFTLCLSEQITNDFKDGAILIGASGCSQEYTTEGGTSDSSGSSCYPLPYANKWFKFQAASQIINIELIRGTILSPKMTLWTFDGQEIACEAAASNISNLSVGSISLTPGETYFLSVDNTANASWKGSFTLCLSEQITNDFKEGAISINTNGCTEEYTTEGGTVDGLGSICSNNVYANKWFKFQAFSKTVKIELIRGTILSPKITLWTLDGQEIACDAAVTNTSNLLIDVLDLIPGETYYISVDNTANASWKGSFTLCLRDIQNICGPLNCNEESVLIGVDDARGYLLAVGGNIISEEVKVALVSNWPDFVLEENYKLLTLEEVDTYISKNKHLPDIPSKTEVDRYGINLGEMDAKLLLKIEELTLYLIEQNKTIQNLKKEVQELKGDY